MCVFLPTGICPSHNSLCVCVLPVFWIILFTIKHKQGKQLLFSHQKVMTCDLIIIGTCWVVGFECDIAVIGRWCTSVGQSRPCFDTGKFGFSSGLFCSGGILFATLYPNLGWWCALAWDTFFWAKSVREMYFFFHLHSRRWFFSSSSNRSLVEQPVR